MTIKWIKTLNRDPVSPKQRHDMQKQEAWRESINANIVFSVAQKLQDTKLFIPLVKLTVS